MIDIGKIIKYRIPTGPRKGEYRPGIITLVYQEAYDISLGKVNLTVFFGNPDDFTDTLPTPSLIRLERTTVMLGYISYGDGLGEWKNG